MRSNRAGRRRASSRTSGSSKLGSLGEGVGSGRGTILGSEAFVEWRAAQQGGLVFKEDALYDPAVDQFFDGWHYPVICMTVRTAAVILSAANGDTFDFPVGTYWLIGRYWAEAGFTGNAGGQVFATGFDVQ